MLFTQVRRTFLARKVQVALIGVMIMMSSMMFSMMYFTINAAGDTTLSYLETHNIEDLSVNVSTVLTEGDIYYLENDATSCTGLSSRSLRELMIESNDCYYQLVDHRASLIESNYDNTVAEYREIKRQKADNGHSMYLVGSDIDNTTINEPYFETGTRPVNSDEIALTPYYMEQNDLNIGDTIIVADIEYTITGSVLFPDITYGMFDGTIFMDISKAAFAYIPYDEFKEVINFETLNVYYSVDIGDYEIESKYIANYVDNFNNTVSEKDDLDFVVNAISTKDNMRSGGIVLELTSGTVMSVFMSAVIAGIAIIIVAIIVAQIVKKERVQIGLLKALGFSRNQIIKPYILLLGLFSLVLLTIGLIIGSLIAPYMGNFFRLAYIIPILDVKINLTGVLLGILVPLSVILLASYLLMRRLLKDEALDMLQPREHRQNIAIRTLSKRKSNNVRRKFKAMITLSSLPKLIMFLYTVMIASFMLLFSFSLSGYLDASDTSLNQTEYEQTAYINPAVSDIDALYNQLILEGNTEKAIEMGVSVDGNDQATLLALDSDGTLYEIFNKKGNALNDKLIGNDVIISYAYYKKNNIDIGDTITINVSTDISMEVVVKGITGPYDMNDSIYINRETVSNELTGASSYYNKVYTDEYVNLEDSTTFIGHTTKDDLRDMNELMSSLMTISLYSMIAFSFAIGFIILFVIISLIIEDNFYNISLLKVVGFSKKEVNSIVFTGLFVLTIVLFILAVPMALLMITVMENIMLGMGMFFPMVIKPIHVVISFAMIMGVFFLVMYTSTKKIERISLQESLKLYQD